MCIYVSAFWATFHSSLHHLPTLYARLLATPGCYAFDCAEHDPFICFIRGLPAWCLIHTTHCHTDGSGFSTLYTSKSGFYISLILNRECMEKIALVKWSFLLLLLLLMPLSYWWLLSLPTIGVKVMQEAHCLQFARWIAVTRINFIHQNGTMWPGVCHGWKHYGVVGNAWNWEF